MAAHRTNEFAHCCLRLPFVSAIATVAAPPQQCSSFSSKNNEIDPTDNDLQDAIMNQNIGKHKIINTETAILTSPAPAPPPTTTTTRVYSSFGLPATASNRTLDQKWMGSSTMDYTRGWAWQQVLLQQRLAFRRLEQNSIPSKKKVDCNIVLLLEHDHVYTLGRGADENHLTFLQQQSTLPIDHGCNRNGGSGDDDDDDDNDKMAWIRQALSRSYRGPGSARLCFDKNMFQQQPPPAPPPPLLGDAANGSGSDNDNHNHEEFECSAMVRALHEQVCMTQATTATTTTTTSSSSLLSSSRIVAPNGVPIYRVERGGEVTYHGPGQLVVYPIFDLQQYPLRPNLHWFLQCIEQVIIQTLQDAYDIESYRDEINTGVWVGPNKVAAVGVSSSRWITTHGFALNVSPDLSYFDTSMILPCGIPGRGVTSIANILQTRGESNNIPSVAEVAIKVLANMQDVFGVEITHHEVIR